MFWTIWTCAFVSGGVFFFIAGTLGLMRFPDTLCRLHALTKVDNLGLGMVMVGVLPQTSSVFDALQVLLIWLLVMGSSAVSGFLVAHHAHHSEPDDITLES